MTHRRAIEDAFSGPAYAIQPDVLLTPDGPIIHGVLAVRDGRVAHCGPAPESVQGLHGQLVHRLEGCAVIPGIIDAHHHVMEPFAKALTFGEPAQLWRRMWFPMEAIATPERCYLGARWTFAEALRGGITTIVEHAVRDPDLSQAVHEAARDAGIRLVSSVGSYDFKGFDSTGDVVKDRSIEETRRLVEAHVKACAGFPRIVPSVACGTVQSNSPEMIAALYRLCAAEGLLFQIHANEHTLEVHRCLELFGKRPIEQLQHIGALGPQALIAHAVLVTPHEIGLLADSGAAVAYCPVASMWKGNGVAPALAMSDRGIRIGLGSDATRNDGFRMMDAAEACQRLSHGMAVDDFSCGAGWQWVKAATDGGADAIGLPDIGRLAPGHPADFLVLDCTGYEVTPSHDFTWELVRLYDRADLVLTVVDGVPRFDRTRPDTADDDFVARARAEGEGWLRASRITRLHPTSQEHRTLASGFNDHSARKEGKK
jgi:cytosine/adenosine deaminase-related metal-dependent hydrolase